MGTANPTLAFTENAGQVLRFPVIKGIAAFEATIDGPTYVQSGNNANTYMLVLEYDTP